MGDLLYSAIETAFGKKALLKQNPTTKKREAWINTRSASGAGEKACI